MSIDNDHIYVAFHNRARTVFFDAVHQFEQAARSLDRQSEERRFRQLKEKHVQTLKQLLEEVASALIERHQHQRQLPELSQSLQHLIKDYLHQFVMRTRAI